MKRRISIGLIILLVYAAMFIVMFLVLPLLHLRFGAFGGYFPFFFFFPFVFGRRGFRRRNTGQNSNQNETHSSDDIDRMMESNYNADEWAKKNAVNFDEYGIRTRSSTGRYWYYVGALLIIGTAIAILVLTGSISI